MLVLCHETLSGLGKSDHQKLLAFIAASGSRVGFTDPYAVDDFFSAISRRIEVMELWKQHLEGSLHCYKIERVKFNQRNILRKLPIWSEIVDAIPLPEDNLLLLVSGNWFEDHVDHCQFDPHNDRLAHVDTDKTKIKIYAGTEFSSIGSERILPSILFKDRRFEGWRGTKERENLLQIAREFGAVNKSVTVVDRYLVSQMCKETKDIGVEKLDTTFPFKLMRKLISGSATNYLTIVTLDFKEFRNPDFVEEDYCAVVDQLKKKFSAEVEKGALTEIAIYQVRSTSGKWSDIWEKSFIFGSSFDLYWHHLDYAHKKSTEIRCDIVERRDSVFQSFVNSIESLSIRRNQAESWFYPAPDFPS